MVSLLPLLLLLMVPADAHGLVRTREGRARGDTTQERPLVRTREGQVRGVAARSAAGKEYTAFRGIPYARPPVGQLRFQPPQRHPGWSHIIDGKEHGSVCPQVVEVPLGDEDCLFVNVYTRQSLPAEDGGKRGLPVMVFIHGGSFIRGSGDDRYFGPSYMMDEDIVLVTLNYRLGPLGFLTTYDGAAPGNNALRDQVMALQWVQDNIAAFGGDPGSVTIFGHSAGSVCVSVLVLSPLTRGLFHRAISQAGAAVANIGACGRRMGFTEELAAELDCPIDSADAMLACLKLVPVQALLAHPAWHFYQPRVDPEADQPVLPEDPRVLLERGDFNIVPWMQGITKEEGWFMVPRIVAYKSIRTALYMGALPVWARAADLTTRAQNNILDCNYKPNYWNAMMETVKIIGFYSEEGYYGISSLLPVAQVVSDRYFSVPIVVQSTLASRYAPVYRYVFEYKGPGRLFWEDISSLNVTDTDPAHGDELMYLFNWRGRPLEKAGSPNHDMIRTMVSLWTSFARTGRPVADSQGAPDWPIVQKPSEQHMRLDSSLTVGERLFEDRVDFWQTLAINEPWRHPVRKTCNYTEDLVDGNSKMLQDEQFQPLWIYG